MMVIPKNLKYHIALLVANATFGSNYAFYEKLIDDGVSSDSLYFLRTVSMFIFFFPAMFLLGKGRIDPKDIWRIIIVTLLIVIGRLYFMLRAMNYTSPIDGSIIATTGPAIVLILSIVALKYRATKWQYAGVALGFAGALTLILCNAKAGAVFSGKMLGNILLFISIVLSAINTLYIKGLYKRYHPVTIIGWAYAIGMLFVVPMFGRDFFSNDFALWNLSTWSYVVYVGLFGTVISSALLYYGLSGISATKSEIYIYIQPFSGTVMAILFGQDHLTVITVAASILIFSGLFCMDKGKS